MINLDHDIIGLHEHELVIAFNVGGGAYRDAHIRVAEGDRNVGNRRSLLRIGHRSRYGRVLGGQGVKHTKSSNTHRDIERRW